MMGWLLGGVLLTLVAVLTARLVRKRRSAGGWPSAPVLDEVIRLAFQTGKPVHATIHDDGTATIKVVDDVTS